MLPEANLALIELDNPFRIQAGGLWVVEDAGVDRDAVRQRLVAGTYERPFVLDDGSLRSLHFSLAYVQSTMRVDDPFALELAYTRKMMAFLLFLPQPKRILLLGLGGGSLAKYCYRHVPLAQVCAVELSTEVLVLSALFELPPADARFRVVQADAAAFIANADEAQEVILLDAFDTHGLALAVNQAAFIDDVRRHLAPQGVLVANLAGDMAERKKHMALLEETFAGNVLVMPVAADGNTVVIGFRKPDFVPPWRAIETRAKAMKRHYGLDFPHYAEKLERSQKAGPAQRALRMLGIG